MLENTNLDLARIVRDWRIYALDELNVMLAEVGPQLAPGDAAQLRRAVGHACQGLLETLIDPLLRAHPQLELDEQEWEQLALSHRR